MVYKTFHNGKYFISFKRGFEETKRDISVSIVKIQERDSLRICLSDDEDPTFLCKMILTRSDYEELKKQQGLLIDFENFPSQMVKLLQQCSTNNMFLIIHQISPIQYNFDIVEHNDFRRLIHLSLKTGPASDEEIKQHMSETIMNLKNSISSLKSALSSSEMLWKDKFVKIEAKVHDLTHTVSIMEDEKVRQQKEFQDAIKLERDKFKDELLQVKKNAEADTNNIIAVSTENLSKKDLQIMELKLQIKEYHDRNVFLEKQLSEKTNRTSILENEVQNAHIQTATLQAKNGSLDKDIYEKDRVISELRSKCAQLEKTIKDNTHQITDLEGALQILNTEKNNLERRLAISDSLANNNNDAVHIKSEQLIKANQIIAKQNRDLVDIKEKLIFRTEIALEQEKVIEKYTKEIESLKSEMVDTKKELNVLKSDLNLMRDKIVQCDQQLKDRDETIKNNNTIIQWLHKKLEDHPTAAQTERTTRSWKKVEEIACASSTPFLPSRNPTPEIAENFLTSAQTNNQLHEISEDSVDYYDPSKSSNLDDSHTLFKKAPKEIDPKYLKPSSEEYRQKKESAKPTSSKVQQKGKENKNINLPKVNYKEKKSARATTYRATPVSAYFP